MISAEAPVLFSKACEMFIMELTYRAWFYTEENKRRTLQKSDISQSIAKTEIFDFLIDIVPTEGTPALPNSQPYPGYYTMKKPGDNEYPNQPPELQMGPSSQFNPNNQV